MLPKRKKQNKEKIKLLLFYNVFTVNGSNEKNKTNNSALKNDFSTFPVQICGLNLKLVGFSTIDLKTSHKYVVEFKKCSVIS